MEKIFICIIFIFLFIPKQSFAQPFNYGVCSRTFLLKNEFIFGADENDYIVKPNNNFCFFSRKTEKNIRNYKTEKINVRLNKKRLAKGSLEIQLTKNNKKPFFIIFGISVLTRSKVGLCGVSIKKYF